MYAAEPGRTIGFEQVAELVVIGATRPSKTGEILALESYFTAKFLNKKQQTIHTPDVNKLRVLTLAWYIKTHWY